MQLHLIINIINKTIKRRSTTFDLHIAIDRQFIEMLFKFSNSAKSFSCSIMSYDEPLQFQETAPLLQPMQNNVGRYCRYCRLPSF